MQQDTNITEVIFRFDKTYGVYALFPYNIYNNSGLIDSYAHVGQHSSADYDGCVKDTRPATEAEYKDLFNELEKGVGYKLKVITRRNYNKYLNAYKNI